MRRQSRELALQILFHIEFTPKVPYSDFLTLFETSFADDELEYADRVVKGIEQNKEKIDAMIQSASRHWKLNRITLVDRNILRIAIFEGAFSSENLKANIVINEALEIAKKYGTEDSSSFINGVLDEILNRAKPE